MSSQTIKEISHNNMGQPVIIVSGGRARYLTKSNIRIARKSIPQWTNTPRHHATGLRYSGEYNTVALVRGDDWDGYATIHTTFV